MLRITLQDSPKALTFKLEGKLTGAWVGELEQCWITGSTRGSRAAVVDLSQVAFIDAEGKELLDRMHAKGVRLNAHSPLNRSIVEEDRASRGPARPLCWPCWCPCCCTAQPEPTPLRLTLRDAVQMALRQNPQVQIANLNLAQSREDDDRPLRPPAAGQLPDFERRARGNFEALIGRSFPGIPQHAGPFERFKRGLFSVPVFDLTLWRRWRASKDNWAATAPSNRACANKLPPWWFPNIWAPARAADVQAAQSRVELAQALYNQAADLQKARRRERVSTRCAPTSNCRTRTQRLITAADQRQTALFGLSAC